MQLNKVSFVGADFEVGQTRKGLSDSSTSFLNFLKNQNVPLPSEESLRLSNEIPSKIT